MRGPTPPKFLCEIPNPRLRYQILNQVVCSALLMKLLTIVESLFSAKIFTVKPFEVNTLKEGSFAIMHCMVIKLCLSTQSRINQIIDPYLVIPVDHK